MTRRQQPNALARALRRFFGDHMALARGLSPHTVRSYRDAFVLLLRFLGRRRGRDVVDLDLVDLDPDSVIEFLEELETDRANCAATRNSRLAAIHAFARFVAAQHPEHLEMCQRILAVPFKRSRRVLCNTLRPTRFGPSSMPPTARRRTAAAITRYSCRSSIRGHACRRFSTCGRAISSLSGPFRSASAARDARSVCVPSGRKLQRHSGHCWLSAESTQSASNRSFETTEASLSLVSAYATCCASTHVSHSRTRRP